MQAYVWDLGFKDMPVDKIVDASVVEQRGRGVPKNVRTELYQATSEALNTHSKGSIGPRCCA
jgi:hypothetical protein